MKTPYMIMKNFIFITFLFAYNCMYAGNVLPEHSSIYTDRMDDELAVYFTPENFNIKTDGSMDVSDALQEAINKVQESIRYGVVFIPEGVYRISKTIYIWKGVRLMGYGKNRPTILLAKNTAGFQEGDKKYMFHFTSDRPRDNRPISDANAGTFYSGIRNVNIKIEAGNPTAIGVRFHAAQHCFLSHMDFHLSPGNIGVEDICNEIEYCRFYGGDYAIKTVKTAPGWQSLVIDSYFEKQQISAIRTEQAGLMIIRNHFMQVPSVVQINDNRAEELWISDSRFERVSGPAIAISKENNSQTQINFENIVCSRVPVFALLKESGTTVKTEGTNYLVKSFSHGLQFKDITATPKIETTYEFEKLSKLPPLVESDVYLLPGNNTWVNIKSLGAKGDGFTDDTDVIEKAIANHQTIYMPSGFYRVTRPIVLKQNTNIVGLHPSSTQLLLRDSTAAYQGVGGPLPLLEAPKGGQNIVSGIGLNTSGINPRAVAAKWMAGEKSMMNDVRFSGGHGTYDATGRDVRVYNDNRTADGIPYRKWDTQHWSLWITDGGGGTFKDIWTPSPYASAGLFISNTSTSGRIYFISIEHHVRYEVLFDNISNWKMYGLQLETESGEGPYCLPIEIKNSRNLLLVNTFLYRVSRATTPVVNAITVENSSNITFKGIHNNSWTKFPFDNSIYDVDRDIQIRDLQIGVLHISDNPAPAKAQQSTPVERLTGGFFDIDGMTIDSKGNVYFVDAHWQRIYCWTADGKLKEICNLPIYPQTLACDENDNLIVVSRYIHTPTIFSRGEVKVLTFNPNDPAGTMKNLEEADFSGATKLLLLQSAKYQNNNGLVVAPIAKAFFSPDRNVAIPNAADLGQTYNLKPTKPGDTFYVSSYSENRTFKYKVNEKGLLTEPVMLAETGGQDVTTDAKGNVYIPSGDIVVYDANGNYSETITVPERPSSVVYSKENNSLYICARTSLYRIKLK